MVLETWNMVETDKRCGACLEQHITMCVETQHVTMCVETQDVVHTPVSAARLVGQ